MIRSLRLGNFKAFGDTQEIPLRPLTLIYGPNSAGKSSIIHSIALAHHAMVTGDLDTQRTEIGGESIDLGGFRQYVHRRDTTKRVEWTGELETKSLTGRLATLLAPARTVAFQSLIGEGASEIGVQVCSLLADDVPLLTMSARGAERLRIDQLDQTHPVFREVLRAIVLSSTTTNEVSDEDYIGMDDAIDALVPEISVRLKGFLPRVDHRSSSDQETMQTLLFPVSRGDRRESLGQAVRLFLPRSLQELVNGLSSVLEDAIGRLRYLGPLRSYPPRHLAFSPHHDSNWRAGGGASWDILRRDLNVRRAVNQWLSSSERLSTPYEVVVRDLIAFDQLDGPLRDAIQAIQDHDGLDMEPDYDREREPQGMYPVIKDVDAEVENFKATLKGADLDRFTELVLIDRRRNTVVSHRDVGIGVSQVLPVLVNAYGYREQLVAIEQPEIHLHPALQAELGDVFIESALGDRRNTFLLETHSEHLLLRMMRRMRETSEGKLSDGQQPLRPDDVIVLYVEPDGLSSIIREMPLNERGELVKAWPGGFFEEGLREIF
jgi:hypothetical protein